MLTPEDEVFAEAAFEFFRFHSFGGDLDGVQDFYAYFDEVREDIVNRAIGVKEHEERLGEETLLRFEQFFVTGFYQLSVHLGAEQHGLLAGDVVDFAYQLYIASYFFGGSPRFCIQKCLAQ